MSKKSGGRKAKPQPMRIPMRVWLIGGAVVGLIVALAIFLPGFNPNASQAQPTSTVTQALPTDISVAQAAQKRDAGAFMLDVREQSEWNEFHMPNATLIPLGSLASRVSELPKDKEIVVVCRSGNRSKEGRDILLKAGFKQVTSMTGGMNEWRTQGFPIATGK
jgi:rhodanese-related sulfurtransferase